ncbi:hypothetical protein [Streptomyces sp. LaPpAH-108]|uniref:hypothetical protein n=1 Tax=Streptomyces sp. LaPpAH-108 TaxID=1155714 RepID=UPI0003666D2C|nr:hypothetical protein [Streptomyces sp. LaPpAH-108]
MSQAEAAPASRCRSSSQDLTTVGTYAEMLSRIAEPALLGLTLLATRGRVKR